MNTSGDVTIIWDEGSDAAIEEIIAKKMAEGMTFFIVEPVAGGLATPKKTALTEVGQAMKNRALAIADTELAAFVSSGAATLVKTDGRRKTTVKRATTAKEVATSASVGMKPRAGG
jgi:hypothetical protein